MAGKRGFWRAMALSKVMRQMLTKGVAIFDKMVRGGYTAAGVLLWFLCFLVLVEVFARYFFRYPMAWAVEIAEYSLVFMCFLATTQLLKQGGHVTMNLVLNRLSPPKGARVNVVTSFIAAVTCLVICYYGGQATWDLFQRGVHISSGLRPPAAAIMFIMPVAFFALFIQFLRICYGCFRHSK